MTTAEKVADSVALRLIARTCMIATPFVLAAMVWLTQSYLDGRFDRQQLSTSVVSARVDVLTTNVNDVADTADAVETRVAVIEANNSRGRQDRMDFQNQMSNRVDKLTDSIAALASNIAALNATVQGMKERQAFNQTNPR